MMNVKGESYRTHLVGTLQLSTLREVKRQFNFGWGTVQTYMEARTDTDMLADMLCDDEFIAWMFAWMRNAGATISRSELEALTVADIDFTTDLNTPEPGEVPSVDPTSAPTDSAPAAGARREAKKPTKTSTKTSKPRSTNGS